MDKQLTTDLQKQLKGLINQLGWSQKKFARELFYERNDVDNDQEVKQFEDKIKKQLNRSTTKPEIIEGYIEFISRHYEFKKLDRVQPVRIESGVLPDEFHIKMESISRKISERIQEDEQTT